MGVNVHFVKTMADARRAGQSFNQALTIGRQDCNLSLSEIREVRRRLVADSTAEYREPLSTVSYLDDLLRDSFGSTVVRTVDYSDFEGADLTHDLNEPIAEDLKGRFDVVIDGGTLEHLFNVPVALRNYMEFVRVGGSGRVCQVVEKRSARDHPAC